MSDVLADQLLKTVERTMTKRLDSVGLDERSEPTAIQAVLDQVSTEINVVIRQFEILPPIRLVLDDSSDVIICFVCATCGELHPKPGARTCEGCSPK